jgi:hypothetical protein
MNNVLGYLELLYFCIYFANEVILNRALVGVVCHSLAHIHLTIELFDFNKTCNE